jgi:hypothetical protein
MHIRALLKIAILTAVLVSPALPLGADQRSPGEQERISYLINHVARMQDAAFVRNGVSYGARIAAYFLRKKWEANQDRVRTADDFIDIIATKSSTTGKAYLIRFKNGKEVESGKYLHDVDRDHCRSEAKGATS